ncbi:hypothetical protein P7C73_g4298, partial [Tremellales sp. Uapishka_1]
MGKSQTKKKTTAARRHNPLRVPDAHLGGGKGDGKADPAKEKQMLPILSKLKSPEYADRTWACAAICNLIQNDPATRRLFQGRNVVGELIERLSDSIDEVIVEASGALRRVLFPSIRPLQDQCPPWHPVTSLLLIESSGQRSHCANTTYWPAQWCVPHGQSHYPSFQPLLSHTVELCADGCFRNLAIDGGHELCGEMFNKGIMSHLIVLTSKISQTIDRALEPSAPQLQNDAGFQARKHLLALTENVISLIWSLAETSHKTLDAVNAAGIEGLLVKVLAGRDALGLGVGLASGRLISPGGISTLRVPPPSAQALYALSVDNPSFKNAMLHHPTALQTLVQVCKQDHAPESSSNGRVNGKGKAKNDGSEEDQEVGDGRALLLRVLVCGVLRNTCEAGSPVDEVIGIASLTNEVILPLVNSLMDVNLENVVARVLELVGQIPEQTIPVTVGKDFKTDHRSPAERNLARMERMLTTVVIGLEILTGICAGVVDAEEVAEEETEEEDEDEEMEDDLPDEALISLGRDPGALDQAEPTAPVLTSSITLPHLLTTLSLPQKLTKLSLPTQLSFPPSTSVPSPHPPTTSVLSVLHLRALEALNNLLLTTAAAAQSDAQIGTLVPSQGIWDGMFGIIGILIVEEDALGIKGQEMRLEVVEMALGCTWGLMKISPAQIEIQSQQIQILMGISKLLKSDLARIRTIETLSALASRPSVPLEENKVIGTHFIQLLTSPPPPTSLAPEILIAVLNAIIDIYADEGRDYDIPIFVQGGFLPALSGTVARVRNDVKKIDRRKQLEVRARGEEAYENLVAFIKYRRTLGR